MFSNSAGFLVHLLAGHRPRHAVPRPGIDVQLRHEGRARPAPLGRLQEEFHAPAEHRHF